MDPRTVAPLLDSVALMIVALDREGRISYVNRQACAVLGRSREDLLGADWFETALPPVGRDAVRAVFLSIVEGRVDPVEYYENAVIDRGGIEHVVAWHNTIVRGEGGGIEGTFSLGEDISRRAAEREASRRALSELEVRVRERTAELARRGVELEEALAREREAGERAHLYRDVAERMQVALTVLHLADPTDPGSLTFVYANPAADAHAGAPMGAYLGRRIDDVAPLTVESGRAAVYAEVVRTGVPKDLGEFLGGARDEKPRWFSGNAFPLPGNCVGVCFANVDSRRRAEEEQRQAHAFLDAIVENIPDMIFVKDARELRFVRFNRAGEDLLGHRREDLLGRNDYDFFPKEEADFFTSKDRAVLAGSDVLDIPEEPIHTAHQGVRYLHTKKVPVRDGDGRPVLLLGISEDITDRKRVQEELDRQRAELARSNGELEQFAYIASHDLQEPLRKVQAFGDRLLSTCGECLGADGRDYLGRMRGAAARMQTLINDLLGYSRVTTQGQPFAPVDLSEVVADVLSDLEARTAQGGGEVEVGPLPVVLADRLQMRQLFQNLVGNALKFHRPGAPPRVRVTASPGAVDGDDGVDGASSVVEVRIEDEGVGFDEAYRDRIFAPFHRLHSRAEFEGTGMGLAICRKIVERHGGTIAAEGRPGRGATFLVRLPAGPAAGGKR